MSVSRCANTASDMSFVRCYEDVEYGWVLLELVHWHSGRTALKVSLTLVALQRPFHMIYLMDRLDYWLDDCSFHARFRTHARLLMVEWYKVEVFAIAASCPATYYVTTPSWWPSFEGHHALSVATPPVLAYFSKSVISDHANARLIWGIVESEFIACTFMAFLGFARNRTVALESGSGLPLP